MDDFGAPMRGRRPHARWHSKYLPFGGLVQIFIIPKQPSCLRGWAGVGWWCLPWRTVLCRSADWQRGYPRLYWDAESYLRLHDSYYSKGTEW